MRLMRRIETLTLGLTLLFTGGPSTTVRFMMSLTRTLCSSLCTTIKPLSSH
nr:hypothetical protein Q903MT_gene85 [Picea sitchensis]